MIDAQVEAAARAIFEHWQFQEHNVVAWVPGGNSFKQGQARSFALAALEAAEKAAWRPISEAPTLERVIVSGIQPKHGTCQAYRWYHEDVTDENGVPMDHPSADLFRSIPTPPEAP